MRRQYSCMVMIHTALFHSAGRRQVTKTTLTSTHAHTHTHDKNNDIETIAIKYLTLCRHMMYIRLGIFTISYCERSSANIRVRNSLRFFFFIKQTSERDAPAVYVRAYTSNCTVLVALRVHTLGIRCEQATPWIRTHM